MTQPRRLFVFAAIAALAAGASACSTINRFNPFHGSTPKQAETEGPRISITAADDRLEPAAALKGVDFALPPPAAVAEWPLPGGTPEQSVENIQGPPGLSVAWRRSFGRPTTHSTYVMAPPVEAGGKVYVMDGEAAVSAIDARSGSVVWRAELRPNDNKRDREAWGGGLAVDGGKLFVTSGYRFVAGLDAATGKLLWRTRTDEPIHAAPTVSAGRLMAVALDNTLLTFDAGTGAVGWTYQALSEPARILAASSPAVSGDTVVASFGSGELVALRVSNGNDLWDEPLSRASRTSSLSEIRDISGRPVIYRGDVFAVSHSGVFTATDLRTGQPRWTLPLVGVTSPLPEGDVVYAVSKTGDVVCASRDNGQIYWMRNLNEGFKPKRQGGFLGAFATHTRPPVWASPLMVDNHLIFAGSSGEVASLNPKTGAVEKRVNLDAPVLIGPIAAGGTLYVVTDNAQLIALR